MNIFLLYQQSSPRKKFQVTQTSHMGLRWSDHLPLTSKALHEVDPIGRSPIGFILMSIAEKSIANVLPKVVRFLRVLRFPPTGKVDRVG